MRTEQIDKRVRDIDALREKLKSAGELVELLEREWLPENQGDLNKLGYNFNPVLPIADIRSANRINHPVYRSAIEAVKSKLKVEYMRLQQKRNAMLWLQKDLIELHKRNA